MDPSSLHDVSVSAIDDILERSRAATNAGRLMDASTILEKIPLDSRNSEPVKKLELEQCRVAFFKGDHKLISSLNTKDDEPSLQLDLWQIYSKSNRIWTDLDLDTVPVNLANSMHRKYISMFTDNEPDEVVVRIMYHCMVIRDWCQLYGEGLSKTDFECDEHFLKKLISKMAEHKLYLEMVDILEFAVDDPNEMLRSFSAHLVAEADPAFGWFTLLLVAKLAQEGELAEAEKVLQLFTSVLDKTSNRDEKDIDPTIESGNSKPLFQLQAEVLRHRYLLAQSDPIHRVQRILKAAETLFQQQCYLPAFRALELAAEILNQIPDLNQSSQLGSKVHHALDRVCDKSGDNMSKLLIDFRYCDLLNSAGGDFALARRKRQELLNLPYCTKMPYLRRYHQRQCAEYMMLQHREAALHHAEHYLEYCRVCRNAEDQSLAENMLLSSQMLPERTSEEARQDHLDDWRSQLEHGIGTDGREGWYKAKIEKQMMLINVIHEIGILENDELEEITHNVQAILKDAEATLKKLANETESIAFECHIRFSTITADLYLSREPNKFGNTTAKHEDSSGDHLAQIDSRVHEHAFLIAVLNNSLSGFKFIYERLNNQLSHPLAKGNNIRKMSLLLIKAQVLYFLSQFKDSKMRQFWSVAGLSSLHDVQMDALQCFSKAMELSESIVGEVNDLHTGSSKAKELVLRQAYLTSGVEKQQNLDMSLELAVELGDSKQIWQWIQRSKARAFSTMLKDLGGGNAAHVDVKFGIDAPNFENLRFIQSASASRLVFVDWISYGFHSRQLLMYCCRIIDGECCTSQVEIDTDLDTLKQAASKINGARMNDSDAERYLRSFESVIEPLQDVCDPGDILLLCPTAPFHNVPLHAVKLGVQVLIERNPIVYVPSQLALLHCIERLAAPKAGMDAPSEWKALVTAAYSDESNETAIKKEREDIYRLSKELAVDLDAELILGIDLTSSAVVQHLQSADVFHFHGHGIKDPHDPTKQCLALGGLGSSLSMGDIASLDLASAHVTLIACSGAVQDFSFSLDEPLGLLSAFLLGGASSVIGALWPIQSETGRSFTRIFYEYFLKHLDRNELGPIVNLSKALQHTVLELKKHDQTSLPYHWAPFICYGSWFCRRKPGTWQKETEARKPKTRKCKGKSTRFKRVFGSSR